MMIPYLHFMGNSKEAMEYYQAVLGGSYEAMPYSAMEGADAEMAASSAITHSALVTEAHGTLYASDYPPGMDGFPQQSVDVVLTFDEAESAEMTYRSLAHGGEVIQEFGATFFSPGYAMFKDRFGTHWMILTESDQSN